MAQSPPTSPTARPAQPSSPPVTLAQPAAQTTTIPQPTTPASASPTPRAQQPSQPAAPRTAAQPTPATTARPPAAATTQPPPASPAPVVGTGGFKDAVFGGKLLYLAYQEQFETVLRAANANCVPTRDYKLTRNDNGEWIMSVLPEVRFPVEVIAITRSFPNGEGVAWGWDSDSRRMISDPSPTTLAMKRRAEQLGIEIMYTSPSPALPRHHLSTVDQIFFVGYACMDLLRRDENQGILEIIPYGPPGGTAIVRINTPLDRPRLESCAEMLLKYLGQRTYESTGGKTGLLNLGHGAGWQCVSEGETIRLIDEGTELTVTYSGLDDVDAIVRWKDGTTTRLPPRSGPSPTLLMISNTISNVMSNAASDLGMQVEITPTYGGASQGATQAAAPQAAAPQAPAQQATTQTQP